MKKYPLNKKKAIRQMRPVARQNEDGTISTHQMAWIGDMTQRRGDFGVYPTITPKLGKEYSSNPEDWEVQTPEKAAMKEEMIYVKSRKMAEKLAAGSWKKRQDRKDAMKDYKISKKMKRNTEILSAINFKDGGGLSRKEDYGSSKKPYPKVSGKDFAGGNRSYPIPTKADAIDALRLAGLHGRSDVKAKVYRKYPELKNNKATGGWLHDPPDTKLSTKGKNKQWLGDSANTISLTNEKYKKHIIDTYFSEGYDKLKSYKIPETRLPWYYGLPETEEKPEIKTVAKEFKERELYYPLSGAPGWGYHKSSGKWINRTDLKNTLTRDEFHKKFPKAITQSGYEKLYADGGLIDSSEDWRIDPIKNPERWREIDLKQSKAGWKGISSGVGMGAAIGTAIGLPGIGTGIGAIVGGLYGGVKGLINRKKDKERLRRESIEWNQALTDHTRGINALSSYKKGGKIKGEGTGKSDDIQMKAEKGSFIVPIENKDKGIEIGKEYLGWDDDTLAKRNYGDTDVNVSNGEVIFTPTEVGLLDYYGVDYRSLAPEAKKDSGKNYKDAGEVREDKKKVLDDYKIYGYNPSMKPLPDTLPKTNIFLPSREEVLSQKKGNTGIGKSIVDNIPEIAGSLQALGGAYGLIKEGASPTMKVSDTLRKLSSEVRQMANYGYEPKVLNALNRQIEDAYKNMTNTIVGKGGSPMETMAKLKETLSTVLDKKADIIYADAAEKARKYADVIRVDTAKAGQEFDASKINIDDYYKKQEAYGSLLSAGLSNIIGARAYKDTLDAIIKTGGTNPFI